MLSFGCNSAAISPTRSTPSPDTSQWLWGERLVGSGQMRFIIFLIIVGGRFWVIDKSAYSGHYTGLAEENAAHLAKAIGDDLRAVVDRLVGKT